jgi:hypothetical protein
MQFRLPALPCPATTLSVDSESSFVRRAFVRTGSGVLQWSPSDGVVPLSSVLLADGLEVRLFSDEQQPAPGNIPGIQVLALCEMSSGQQLLTCVCRFSQWNPLVHNIRIRIPRRVSADYRIEQQCGRTVLVGARRDGGPAAE